VNESGLAERQAAKHVASVVISMLRGRHAISAHLKLTDAMVKTALQTERVPGTERNWQAAETALAARIKTQYRRNTTAAKK